MYAKQNLPVLSAPLRMAIVMQARSVLVLAFGLVIALGTAWSLKQRMAQAPEGSAAVQVLVASGPIGAGQFIRADNHLTFATWPEENITEQMLTSNQVKLTDFTGAVARRDIAKGEPIQKALLVKSDEGGFMAAVLDPGKRAISIAVDSTSGNAGFIFPGDYVDLILTHSVQTRQNPVRASETFVENVRVLAVDQMLTNPENKAVLAKTVTIEVSPKQAEEVNVAKDLGKISLSLRSLAMGKKNTAPIETFDDVLRHASEEPAANNVTRDTEVSRIIAPTGGANMRVRVIRGNQYQDVEFGPTGASEEGPDAR